MSYKSIEDKLELSKKETEETIKSLKRNISNENINFTMEDSQVTNHPADISSELFEKEKDMALINNQLELTNKIDDALNRIEEGKFGECDLCSKKIESERLEILPYTTICASCAKKESGKGNIKKDYISETSIKNFYDVYNALENSAAYESEENLICIQEPDYLMSGCVEDVESISNSQYREYKNNI